MQWLRALYSPSYEGPTATAMRPLQAVELAEHISICRYTYAVATSALQPSPHSYINSLMVASTNSSMSKFKNS